MRSLVVFLGLAVVAVCGSNISGKPRADSALAKFLLSRQAQLSTASSAQCFNIYLPLLSQVADQWQQDYDNCLNIANESRSGVLQQKRAEQEDMSQDADNVCQFINTCQANNASLEFFECFSALSQNVLGSVYTISNNASDLAADLVEQLNSIDVSMYKCTNVSERAYVENTANIYEALDICLQYGPPPTVPPQTSSSTSSAAAVTEPTTVESNDTETSQILQSRAALQRSESKSYAALRNWINSQIHTP